MLESLWSLWRGYLIGVNLARLARWLADAWTFVTGRPTWTRSAWLEWRAWRAVARRQGPDAGLV